MPQRELDSEQAGTPRWVKVFGVVTVVLLILLVVALLVGGGEHGPRRHSAGDSNMPTPHAGATRAPP